MLCVLPKLPRQLHLAQVLTQVLDRVEERPRRRHLDRVARRPDACACGGSRPNRLRWRFSKRAVHCPAISSKSVQESFGVVFGHSELGIAVAVGERLAERGGRATNGCYEANAW